MPPEARGIGIVPQEGALFPHLDVAANVAFGLPRGSAGRVEELLELVGMPGHRRRVARTSCAAACSSGWPLARALAPPPVVVLLDEPFSALDAGLRVGCAARCATC